MCPDQPIALHEDVEPTVRIWLIRKQYAELPFIPLDGCVVLEGRITCLWAQGIAWLELTGSEARMSDWLSDDAGLTLVWVKGQAPGIKAVGVATEGEPIVIRSLDFDQKSSPPAAHVPEAAEQAEPQDGASKDPGVFESALERVEHAVEVAAERVEHAVEQLTFSRK